MGVLDNRTFEAARGFRVALTRELERQLKSGEFHTPAGSVQPKKRKEVLNYPTGNHGRQPYWVYRRRSEATEMLFSFFEIYHRDDFSTKVIVAESEIGPSEGPTIQFGARRSFEAQDRRGVFGLYHSAVVNINQGLIGRERLLAAMRNVAGKAVELLGGIPDDAKGWTFFIGDTSNVGELIDRLFLYSFAVDQAKRHLREVPVPLLPRLRG